jgi:hypothetical protein
MAIRCWTKSRVLAVSFVAIAVCAATSAIALAVTGRGPQAPQVRVARGVVNGAFHPVAGKFRPDGTKLDECRPGDMRCFEQAFGNLAYRVGPKPALALCDRRMAVDKTVSIDCHRIAHMIGSAALAYFRGNVGEAYSHGSATCASGYFHGILERAFAGVHSQAGLIHAARTLCRGAGVRRRGFLDYQCTHGLGHGLMIQTGYDLPMALRVCGRLQTRWDEISCTGGVFMENGSTVYGMRSPWLKRTDPIYPCEVVRVRDRGSCYLRVTTQILQVNHFDWRDTSRRCRAIVRRWQTYCFKSYGRDAANLEGGNPQKVLPLCGLAGSFAGQCLYGASRSIADHDAGASRAIDLCRRASRSEKSSCFAGLGVVIGLLHSTDRARLEACRSAAELRWCMFRCGKRRDPARRKGSVGVKLR